MRRPYLGRRTVVNIAALGLVVLGAGASAQVPPGHRLPEGPARPVREREIDVQHVALDLRFDMPQESIRGRVSVTFAPLRAGLSSVSLDAAGLSVEKVESGGRPLVFDSGDRALRVTLSAPLEAGQSATLDVSYSARPKSGLYFQPAEGARSAQAWNYGEGGLHYGWVPLYNDTNDRFTVDLLATVPKPLVVAGNGVLKETTENADGTRTFHWVQDQPIPNYLLALDVGEFVRVGLGEAKVGGRSVPVGVWGPPGTEASLAYAFSDTARMVEFFSERYGYPYAWAKYDQISLHEFEGAMETTTMVGFGESYARRAGDPPDSHPDFDHAYPTWTAEDTIAHELAHHWFGDLLTCRSLGSLWLNESFATFSHTLWTAHAHGEDDLTYQRWRYLNTYLDYVRKTGAVRPLEYLRYAAPGDMYQEETTYLKGSLVLHMLRHMVGDADFFRTLGDYLRANAFGNVDSADLKEAFQRSTGRNVSAFFDDWITGGGGHPSFDVSYAWSAERKQVDLTVKQVQADLPFENAFQLPVDVEIVTAAGRRTHTVPLDGWSTRVSLPAEARPLAVVFDKGNWLVAEVRFERPLEERLYLLDHGDVADRLRAIRQIVQEYPRRPEAAAALVGVLADTKAHWGVRQEAAVALGAMGGDAATTALLAASKDTDARVRRAAATALASAGGPRAETALRALVQSDPSEDVVGTAALGLGQMHASGARDFLKGQLARDSRWWEEIRTGVVKGLAELEDPSLAPVFAAYLAPRYPRQLREAALDGWFRAQREDPALASRLRELTADRNRSLRENALGKLGSLHRAADLAFLREIAASEPDTSLAEDARAAAEEIQAFAQKP